MIDLVTHLCTGNPCATCGAPAPNDAHSHPRRVKCDDTCPMWQTEVAK